MKLTPFAKLFITLVIVGVLGYAFWHYKGADVRQWAVGEEEATPADTTLGSSDFDALRNAPPDPKRGAGAEGVTPEPRSPGPASSDGRSSSRSTRGRAMRRASCSTAASMRRARPIYTKKYGLDVKFVLIEDPAAKLAAFRNGDVDIMWNTVDNWAREASILAEQNQQAKSIILQDWSRGGDGIVSLSSSRRSRT